jgi:peptide/nickel transport system substrate-binding protein
VLVLVLAGCGGMDPHPIASASTGPQRGGTAVIGSISDVDSWNEYLSHQVFAGNLQRRIFLRLAQELGESSHSPQAYAPQLAESWSFAEDGLSLTFKLRPARWSDGQPIRAADVRYTWQAQTAPEVPWASAATKQQIRDVEIVDDRTVTFHFKSRYPYQLADAVEGAILPAHVYGNIPFDRWVTHDWSSQRVGSGPFLLDSYQPGHEIVLARNPLYFEQAQSRLDRVVVRIVPDAGNLLTQLLAGEIDYLEGIAPRDAARLAGGGNPVTLVAFDAPQYDFIGWNGARPPFDDPELRRAMTLAIDREALVEELLFGYGRVSRGPLPGSAWGADRSIQPLPHDPAAARRLLAERGFATESGGPGKVLELELLTNSGNRLREDVLLKIQEQLSRVGVRATLRPLEMKTMRERVQALDYDAYVGGWTFAGKADLEPMFGSAFTPPAGMNVVSYRSPAADRLLAELDRASTWAQVQPLLAALQQRIHADQPYTFLYESRRIAGHGPRLRGVRIDLPADSLARLEEYWVQAR